MQTLLNVMDAKDSEMKTKHLLLEKNNYAHGDTVLRFIFVGCFAIKGITKLGKSSNVCLFSLK